MSKYGDLIKEARKIDFSEEKTPEQNSGKKETKNSSILENQKTSISETKKTRITENQKTSVQEGVAEKLAGISIKVPENLRRHWVVESKKSGKSMTSVIIEALTKEFGAP